MSGKRGRRGKRGGRGRLGAKAEPRAGATELESIARAGEEGGERGGEGGGRGRQNGCGGAWPRLRKG